MSLRFLNQLDDLFCVVQLRVVSERFADDELLLFSGIDRLSLVSSAILEVVYELDLICAENLIRLSRLLLSLA